jgi:hypothetical protein
VGWRRCPTLSGAPLLAQKNRGLRLLADQFRPRIRRALDLETHGTPRGFARWHLREGTLPPYQLAFLMGDCLVERRRGLANVTAYFQAFSNSSDRQRNFAQAFGTTLAEFERDVLVYLRAPEES